MKSLSIGSSHLVSSRLAYGCWRLAGTWEPSEVTPEGAQAGIKAVLAAYDSGYSLFDHADIYCHGVAEDVFGKALKQASGMREKILVSTKCGIRFPGDPWSDSPQRYDFSRQHIISSCEGSLKRLGIETIDLYQLHRPDFLADPDEVASAFTHLRNAGKVREFGVSNFRPSLLAALQKACPMKLLVNQIEISLARLDAFENGALDQCLEYKLTPLAWSPLGGGVLGLHENSAPPGHAHHVSLNLQETLRAISEARGVSRSVIALSWLLKHPARIIPIVGSVNPKRIQEAAQADEIELTRDEWYRLLIAARGQRLP